ncbi:MAG: GGDEF domain-containing protein [Vallitalea sp.]|jgi:diguanylate cyclase (GGDEF)-like protein|nr:GGDEF domain-containing protein [Vallitalea sp.]
MSNHSVYFRLVNKLSLRKIILIPVFIILLLGSTLSYLLIGNFVTKYTAKVIGTNQIRIKNHIYDHLDDYFKIPELINLLNVTLVKNKQLDTKDELNLGKILLDEVNSNPSIDYAYFANSDGGIVSSGLYNGTNRISYTEGLKGGPFKIHEVDDKGNIINFIKSVDFDPRNRSWYTEANEEGKAYWTEVYSGAQEPILGMSTSSALFSANGEKIGVFGTDILLVKLAEFLKTIEITENGIVCLVDEQGLIVASSTPEKPFKDIEGSQTRLASVESENSIISEGYKKIISEHNQFFNEDINDNFKVEGEEYYYNFSKYSYKNKINWNLMIAIPRKDLIGDIEFLFFKFSIIFLVIILLILLAYLFISRWILAPITDLNNKVNQISNDNWGVQIETERNDELGHLTRSFNNMSSQLNEYLTMLNNKQKELEYMNTSLEEIVQERTKELELLSITDGLTNIYNKRYLMEILDRYINESKRYNKIFSIVMLDIDYFKKVNDTYGHTQGDITLKEISKCLSDSIRDVDILGRYGGEEFIIIMPNTELNEAYVASERYRIEISKMVIGDKGIRITISGGVAEYKANESSIDIIERADENLYIAKESGRNRVIK